MPSAAEGYVTLVTDQAKIDEIISKSSIKSVRAEAKKDLREGASLLEVTSPNFYYLQQIESRLFYHDVAKIMKEAFNATAADYWYLTTVLPKAPSKPVIYVVLKKNM